MRALRLLLLSTVACGLAACGDSDGESRCNGGGGANQLEGSYCEDVEMLFTEVRLTQLESGPRSYLRIEYVRPIGTGLEKTLSVVFDTNAVMITEGEKIDLLAAGGSVTRVLTTGAVNLTDDLEGTNTVQLDTWTGALDSRVTGRVDLSFSSGRKLSGTFDGTLADAMPSE